MTQYTVYVDTSVSYNVPLYLYDHETVVRVSDAHNLFLGVRPDQLNVGDVIELPGYGVCRTGKITDIRVREVQ